MTFLQPLMLAMLPLIGLPIIIHLINQRRFQTVPWAAMMFLVSARALSRGYSRLRHWLILAMRMLAVAAVILAVGRPLARGWLALAAGGRPDTAIVIVDRSPSMQQRQAGAADSKLDTGRRQLAESLSTLDAAHCVLITDASRPPLELDSPGAITDLPGAGPAATAADMPLLLQAAYDYVRENAAGTTEVWICSDQRSNDWAPESGVWPSLRDGFAKLPQQVRFQLLSFAEPAEGNRAVRVKAARVERRGDGHELLLTVAVIRQDDGERTVLPLKFEIGGGSSTVDLELTGREAVLKNHPIPLDRSAGPRGWGRVSIPSDSNAADNDFYFVFDEPVARKSIVVAEDATARRWLSLLAEIPPEKDQTSVTEAVVPGDFATLQIDDAAVVLWQGPLPSGTDAERLEALVARGGQLIFFPPETPTDRSFAGVSWTAWKTHPQPVKPVSWRNDGDLLANTASGEALPVGELEIFRSCELLGDVVPLASFSASAVLLGRVAEDRGGEAGGGIVFCTTTPNARNSTLASEGVVLYAAVQRAIDRGLAALGTARQLSAGETLAKLAEGEAAWERLAGPNDSLTSETGLHAGVFTANGRLVAVNRPAAEDAGRIAADERIDGLFRDLAYARIAGRAGDSDSLVQEIWRAFLIAMAAALIAEAILCWPKSPTAGKAPLPRVRSLEAAA